MERSSNVFWTKKSPNSGKKRKEILLIKGLNQQMSNNSNGKNMKKGKVF